MTAEMTPYDRVIEYIFNNNETVEAKAWISDQEKGPRAIFEFNRGNSEHIIDMAYAKGAEEVLLFRDQNTIEAFGCVDILLVRLPEDPGLREQLFEFEDAVAHESGFEGSLNQGKSTSCYDGPEQRMLTHAGDSGQLASSEDSR